MRSWIYPLEIAASLALGQMCSAQQPTPHSLSMDVTATSTGGATHSSANTNPGGQKGTTDYNQKRNKESGISLLVQVRNVGRTPDGGKLEWFFFAKPLPSKEHDFMFESGNKDITVGVAASEDFPIKSGELKSKVEKQMHTFNGLNADPTFSVKKSGSTIEGWIVRLMVDGKPYQIRASSPSLEALARNDNQLGAYPRKPK